MLQDQKPTDNKNPSIDKPVPVPKAPEPIKSVPIPKAPEPKVIETKIIDLKLPKAPRDCVEQILEYKAQNNENIKISLPPDQPSVGIEIVGPETITLSYINRNGYCGSRIQINPLH